MNNGENPFKLMRFDEIPASCTEWSAARSEEAARLKPLAADLSKPPQCGCRQWAVTPYGVECRTRSYAIPADALWSGEEKRGWVKHMSLKSWVDLPDFAEALRAARRRLVTV